MKRLALLFTLILLALSFRYLSRDINTLPELPDSITFLANNLIVAKTGTNISVYNTQTHQLVQTYSAQAEDTDVQVAPQSNMVLFLNNKSIYQLQQNSTKSKTYPFTTNIPHYVYGLSTVGNTVMIHELSTDGTQRSIRLVNTSSQQSYSIQGLNSNDTMVAGSGMTVFSLSQYYFVSGGLCNSQDKVIYFFQGNQFQIKNVQNLTIPGCKYKYLQGHKQEWKLSSINSGGNNRTHAITYVLNQQINPRVSTTQILITLNGYPSYLTRFDTNRLIGVDFINNSLYTADDEMCRVIQHFPSLYAEADTINSNFTFDMTQAVISPSQELVLALTGTDTAYLLDFQNNFTISQTLIHPQSAVISQAFFSNTSLILSLDDTTNFNIYDSVSQEWVSTQWTNVLDFCVTPSNLVFSVSKEGNSYVLATSSISFNGNTFQLNLIDNMTLSWSFSDVMCLDSNSVLVNPSKEGQPIARWVYNNGFINPSNLIKIAQVHALAHTTGSAIYFSNADQSTTPLFYNYSLSPLVTRNTILLPPSGIYKALPTLSSNYTFFLTGTDSDNFVSIDKYNSYLGQFSYKGSFPLRNNGLNNKIFIFPKSNKIILEYGEYNLKATYEYSLDNTPQSIRGHFYDPTEQICTGYKDALFRLNPNTQDHELLIVNTIASKPTLEKYNITSSNTLDRRSSSILNGFVETDLQMELSQDQQNLVIHGIKKGNTITDTIQIRNANNLADVTYEQIYFNKGENKDLQAYTLLNNQDLYASIITPNSNGYTYILESGGTSGGKVSTGDQLGDVSLFATCGSCNYFAAVGTNANKILLINPKTGVTRSTITTSCSVTHLSLSYDGLKIAYFCSSSTNLFTYDTASETHVSHGFLFFNVTSIKLLSSSSLLMVQNGVLVFINLQTTTPKLVSSQNIKAPITSTIAISNTLGMYATKLSDQVIEFNDFSGKSIQNYTLSQDEGTISSLAFAPNGNLAVTTDKATLVVLTSNPCLANSTDQNGICVCDNTFMADGDMCHCSSFMTLQGNQCVCSDGQFFVSATECGECSWACSSCSGDGVTGCNGYSAGFIVLIVVIFVLLAVLGVLVFKKMQKRSRKDDLKEVSKQQSSDLLVHDPLIKEKEYS